MLGLPITLATPPLGGPCPARADVVIIGGGIIGIATGWALARAGLRTVVLEKGRVAAEQSGRNWGWIRAQGRDPDELPLVMDAQRWWRGLPNRMQAAIGLAQPGVMYLAGSATEEAEHAAWLTHAQAQGLDTQILSARERAARMPGAAPSPYGALWTASDMRAEPWVTVPALARAAIADGLGVIEQCAARTLDIVAGRVAGVWTEQGRIGCDAVLVAGGAWSSLFLRNAGVMIPQLAVKATVAVTAPLPDVFGGNTAGPDLAFRRRADGGYTITPSGWHEFFIGPDALRHLRPFLPVWAKDLCHTRLQPWAPGGYPDGWGTPRHWGPHEVTPFERMRILDPSPSRGLPARLARRFRAMFPALPTVTLTHTWGGMIDTMPDVVPVIDAGPIPGLYIGTGLSGHGFGIGPAVGAALAALIRNEKPAHDLRRFRYSRFTDGSRLTPGPSL